MKSVFELTYDIDLHSLLVDGEVCDKMKRVSEAKQQRLTVGMNTSTITLASHAPTSTTLNLWEVPLDILRGCKGELLIRSVNGE